MRRSILPFLTASIIASGGAGPTMFLDDDRVPKKPEVPQTPEQKTAAQLAAEKKREMRAAKRRQNPNRVVQST